MFELKSYFNIFGSLIVPPICKSCGVLLSDNEDILCDCCKNKIDYIERPNFCYKCGISGHFDTYRSLCPICENNYNYSYKLIRTIVNYNDIIRPVILDYKYERGLESGDYITKDIIKHFPKELKNIKLDYITCVSTHWFKLLNRGFNHTEYISKQLAKILNIPFVKFVKKYRYTRSQTKYDYSKRMSNINNSFKLTDFKNYKNQNILVFEDVVTTGSTLNEYVDILKKTNANIYVLVYADARKLNRLLEIKYGVNL